MMRINWVKMFRSSLVFLGLMCLVFSAAAQAQRDSISVHQSVQMLNTALVKADAKTLKKLLHKSVTYAHSNGWVEQKKELIRDLKSGKFAYRNIDLDQVNITLNENVAIVKTKGVYDINMNRQDLQFKLSVLQVWQFKKKHWVLMSRQSVQLP